MALTPVKFGIAYTATQMNQGGALVHLYTDGSVHLNHGGTPHPLEGVSINNRLGVLYSQDGLNDTAHTEGCCCCGGNEVSNCEQINVNILAYALLY